MGEAQRVNARMISADYFKVLGVTAQLGRTFAAADDSSSAPPVVLISAHLWNEKFGSSADVLEKSLTLDDKSYQIIGVIPQSFNLTSGVDVYVPIAQWNSPALKRRSAALGIHGIGRMKPGVTVAQAQSDLDRIMQALAIAYPETNKGNGAKVMRMRDRLVGNIELTLWTLLAAVGFVLLIANSLANRRFSMIVLVSFAALALLLATLGIYGVISYLVGQRTHELGIRLALGAGRGDILRLILTHGMKMAISGVVVGLIAAFALTRLMSTMLFGVRPTDPATFAIIAFVLVIVALLACYLPARRATKVDPLNALRAE